MNNALFIVLEPGGTEIKVWAGLVSDEDPVPIDSCLLSVPSYGGRDKQALWGIFSMGPNLIHKGSHDLSPSQRSDF